MLVTNANTGTRIRLIQVRLILPRSDCIYLACDNDEQA